LCALTLLLAQAPPSGVPAPGVRDEVARLHSAAAQLEAAGRLRAALRGAQGAARAAKLRSAVAAYRAVRVFWPGEQELCAQAAFRAGEMLRTEGDEPAALVEFQFVRGLKLRSAWQARAGHEIAHIHRRAARHTQSLESYLAVHDDPRSEPARRDEAALWAGREYVLLGKQEEARRRWRALTAHAEDPLLRIDAWDELALASVDAGDLEGAAGWLGQAREALADVGLQETEHGERVRGALERMRAIRRLERAVAQRVRDAQK
jgi:tetratricopeptide (TPR) repeat protein